MTQSITPSLVVEPKAITITQYEALQSDIQIARQSAIIVGSFDYSDPKGDKAARSYIAGLRKIRSRIESARKEAKSYALDYGRAVDAQAKVLEAEILGLIQPHQQALDAIAQREKQRVAAHEESLRLISAMVQSAMIAGQSAAVIADAIGWLRETATADLEEFQEAAEAEISNGIRLLSALHTAAVEREKREAMEAAEAQRLAEEDAARRKAEDDAQVQIEIRKAEERARQEAEDQAAREMAAAAHAQADAELRAREAELRARMAEDRAEVAAAEENRRAIAQREAEAALRIAEVRRRNDLHAALTAALGSKTRAQVVEALLDGTLHPAVRIDWAKA